jgi:ABC-type nitrate/sulfonate/bicarbonate transport system substrate-binding protein
MCPQLTIVKSGDAARSLPAIRLGYVPLAHAAPLIAAANLGFFHAEGLRVRLSREVGWATVREKLLSGELDAAQALAPMPVAMTLGLNCARADCVAALVLNLHGNAIVFSRRLWALTQGDPARLIEQRRERSEPLTFGVVYPHSGQLFVLRQWLSQAGLVPDHDYRLVVVPPPQMVAHMEKSHLDGFCVGEPWASLAVRTGAGEIVALSSDLAPGHAEKVLMLHARVAEESPEEHFR